MEGDIRGEGVGSDLPDRKVMTTRDGIIVDEALDALTSSEKLEMVRDFFAENFFPTSASLSNQDKFMNGMPTINNPEIFEHDLSSDEILEAINKSPNNKAPGLDRLSFEFYKKFSVQLSKILSKLVKFSCEEGFLLKSCRSSVATLIFKSSDPKILKNYRTISLTNSYYKIISLCIKSRLNSVLPSIIDLWGKRGVNF